MDHDLKLCEHTYFTLPSTFSLKWSKEYKIREKGRPVLEIRIKCYQHLGAWRDICKIFYRQKKKFYGQDWTVRRANQYVKEMSFFLRGTDPEADQL